MIEILATNIVSPLGLTTEENYRAVRAGRSALESHCGWRGIPNKFTASIFNEEQAKTIKIEGFTLFESSIVRSIREALLHCDIDISSPRTILILSTTKANIDALDPKSEEYGKYLSPAATAKKVAAHFGITSEPIVVCNACISGVTAQVLADRLLSAGIYDVAIVCGADSVTPFVASGFLSFKTLSPMECRPFDIERLGLNLGDGAATIIFGRADNTNTASKRWQIVDGQLSNDAYHTSTPSPVGEGTVEALKRVLDKVSVEDIGVICVHGTATMFNDQMESKAIERSGLSDIPISALKGYYGHTLGAAGVLETILAMRALDDGIVLPLRGFSEIGVGGRVNISNQERKCDKKSLLKIISGFGSCNGVLLYAKGTRNNTTNNRTGEVVCTDSIHITPTSAVVNGEHIATTATGMALLKELYKGYIGDCTKFHKMDALSRLAVLASSILLQRESEEDRAKCHDIVLFNNSSSIVADLNHLRTIADSENFYPSPSVFLHTLPNIATGEVAIQNSFKGETSLYILDRKCSEIIDTVATVSLLDSDRERLITGWIDCSDDNTFEAEIKILTKK